jgi:hypothetical protein
MKTSTGLVVELKMRVRKGELQRYSRSAKCISGSFRKAPNSLSWLSLELRNLHGGIGQIFLLQYRGSLL